MVTSNLRFCSNPTRHRRHAFWYEIHTFIFEDVHFLGQMSPVVVTNPWGTHYTCVVLQWRSHSKLIKHVLLTKLHISATLTSHLLGRSSSVHGVVLQTSRVHHTTAFTHDGPKSSITLRCYGQTELNSLTFKPRVSGHRAPLHPVSSHVITDSRVTKQMALHPWWSIKRLLVCMMSRGYSDSPFPD